MKDNLSDFLKMAYKHNKVKDLKQAFEEFPVEEWHKGKIENVIRNEKIEEYKESFYDSLKHEN